MHPGSATEDGDGQLKIHEHDQPIYKCSLTKQHIEVRRKVTNN